MPFSGLEPNELSLFDPENLHHLELLRQTASPAPSAAAPNVAPEKADHRGATTDTDLDRIFDRFKIAADDNDWHIGSVDIEIIHRGRMRIATHDWPPLIMYCKHDTTERGIVKQFRLHVLRYAGDVRLVYGTYRFKLQIAKAWVRDYRCGKLIDARATIRESMVNLAYWLTAQPHAETNYSTWEALIDEAIAKLDATQ